ncbi:hypothetical protein G9A89_004581 [Geosiphon pyriformis]|nr:hypothetical protein G9A89_004581 [Geosiphon pyriformis]
MNTINETLDKRAVIPAVGIAAPVMGAGFGSEFSSSSAAAAASQGTQPGVYAIPIVKMNTINETLDKRAVIPAVGIAAPVMGAGFGSEFSSSSAAAAASQGTFGTGLYSPYLGGLYSPVGYGAGLGGFGYGSSFYRSGFGGYPVMGGYPGTAGFGALPIY